MDGGLDDCFFGGCGEGGEEMRRRRPIYWWGVRIIFVVVVGVPMAMFIAVLF